MGALARGSDVGTTRARVDARALSGSTRAERTERRFLPGA